MTLAVYQDGDKVIVDLGGRRRDVLLTCGEAERFEHALRAGANGAELVPPALVRGEVWEIAVQSFDGKVALRFIPPLVGNATRVPLPPDVARTLADRVRFKRQQAAYKMRFAFGGV